MQKPSNSGEFKKDLEMLLNICETMIPLDEPQKSAKVDIFIGTCLTSESLSRRLSKDGSSFMKWLRGIVGKYPWAEDTVAKRFPRMKGMDWGKLERDSSICSELSFLDLPLC